MIVIDDAGVEVKEVALTSNADSGNNSRLRYLAIQDNGSLRYFWTDQEGGHGATSWTEVSTGVTDADGLLDATYAEGHTGTYLYIVYESNLTSTINLLRFTPGDIVVVESGLGLADTAEIRISAFGETVAVLFTVATEEATMIEDSVWELKVRISHDGGDSWTEAALLSHLNDSEDVVSADLTLRHDQGIGVTWAEGEEAFWMRCREYSSSAFWSEPVLISDAIPVPFVDAARIEAFPGLGWAVLNNRFIDPWHRSVVFDMAPVIFFDGFESGGVSHW
jgi:hypothetical protein